MKIIDIILAAGPLSDALLQIAATDEETVFVRTQNNSFLLHISGKRIVFEAVIDTTDHNTSRTSAGGAADL